MKLPEQCSRASGPYRRREVEICLQASMRIGARLDGMANESELLINVVNGDKPNMLIGLNQKVRGRILFWLMRVHGHL